MWPLLGELLRAPKAYSALLRLGRVEWLLGLLGRGGRPQQQRGYCLLLRLDAAGARRLRQEWLPPAEMQLVRVGLIRSGLWRWGALRHDTLARPLE